MFSCNKDKEIPDKSYPPSSHLVLKFKFDSLQDRLDNQGAISNVPIGFGGYSPDINLISIGLIELLTDSTTVFGNGYRIMSGNGATIANDTGYSCCWDAFDNDFQYTATLSANQTPNTFRWIRIYFTYENFNIKFLHQGIVYDGTVSAFLARKAFTNHFQIKDSIYNTYSVKTNGEWFLEVDTPGYGVVLHDTASTTAPNVLYSSLLVPSGGCIVTCLIDTPLYLGSSQTKTITISMSTNKSFEWVDHSDPAFFEPFDGDTIVDVGIRGLRVIQ